MLMPLKSTLWKSMLKAVGSFVNPYDEMMTIFDGDK
jgi:hypothetical protein